MNMPFSILLAQRSRGDSLSESFRNHAGAGRDDVLLVLLMAAALLAGLWAASRLLGLRRRRRGYHSPWRLFRALCKVHNINWSDRWLLQRIARQQGLRDPARLFLEIQRWDDQTLGPASALEFVRLRTLRNRIFHGAGTRHAGLNRQSEAKPSEGRMTSAVVAASPLRPNMPMPTLDVPPWTEAQSVES